MSRFNEVSKLIKDAADRGMTVGSILPLLKDLCVQCNSIVFNTRDGNYGTGYSDETTALYVYMSGHLDQDDVLDVALESYASVNVIEYDDVRYYCFTVNGTDTTLQGVVSGLDWFDDGWVLIENGDYWDQRNMIN